MLLSKITKTSIRKSLENNHTSKLKVSNYMDKLNENPILFAHDEQFTVITQDSHIGIAKRAVSSKKRDEQNLCIGVSIAMSRL